MRLSRRRGQVTHVLLTRSPLIQNPQKQVPSPFDLHVLSTPPAFVLSQDQTLQTKPTKSSPNQPQTQPARTQSQYNSPENQTRPNPTPKQRGPGKPKQNNPKNHTQQKITRSPQGHGIKNMTHYRVLKQHTQPQLNQVFRLDFALASNSATLEHLLVRRQPQKHCSRSHRSTFCCSEFAAGTPGARPEPFGSGLYFRQVHPVDVKPIVHDSGHIDFSPPFQPFR